MVFLTSWVGYSWLFGKSIFILEFVVVEVEIRFSGTCSVVVKAHG